MDHINETFNKLGIGGKWYKRYKRNETVQDLLLQKNNPLFGDNSNTVSCQTRLGLAEFFLVTNRLPVPRYTGFISILTF